MKKAGILITTLLLLVSGTGAQPGGIGSWREHLPYNSAIDLAFTTSGLAVATPYALFLYRSSTQEIDRITRISGLTETGISAIAGNTDGSVLLVAYKNNNLDLLTPRQIINIPDILRNRPTQPGLINKVYARGSLFYLSTALGVIVVDATAHVIRDTWRLGTSGSELPVNALLNNNSRFLAATAQGLLQAPESGSNLADYRSWTPVSGTNGLPAGPCTQLASIGNKTLALTGQSVYIEQQGQWSLFYQSVNILNLQANADRVTITERNNAGQMMLTVLDENGNTVSQLQQPGVLNAPRAIYWQGQEAWVADSTQGLLHYSQGQFTAIVPNSPMALMLGQMQINSSRVYVAAGTVSYTGIAAAQPGAYAWLEDGEWHMQQAGTLPALDSLPDIQPMAVHPTSQTLYAGSFGGGLLQVDKSGQVSVYKQGFLQPDRLQPNVYRVTGLAIDEQQDLWISNYGAARPLALLRKTGQWYHFQPPAALSQNSFGPIVVDNNGYKWIIPVTEPGLFCYNSGPDAASAADDQWLWFRAGSTGLPDDKVYCVVTDRQGFIWIGTANGIGMLTCAADLFTGNACSVIRPVVAAGSTGAYLFQGERVQCMAVDGADRKWVGTTNGAWLLSAGGDTVISRFTSSNSPLPANDVRQITIDPASGEVYFQTSNGMVSYRGTATAGTSSNGNVLVFPNPVPPSYSGTIAIRGLAEDAFIKITELNGRLLYQTRALGGQAIWNGRDGRGQLVAAGVYLVLVTDQSGKESIVARIVVVK